MFSVSSLIILIVTELTGAGQDATHVARLQARSMFKDIRAEAEEYIYKKLVSIRGPTININFEKVMLQ